MRAFVLSMLLSVGFLTLSVTAMRRGQLRERAALLWLGVSLAMVFVTATLPFHLLDRVSRLVGIDYPPDLLLLLAVLFLFVLVFHLTLSLDRVTARLTALAQEVGLARAIEPAAEVGGEEGRPAGAGAAPAGPAT